MEVLVKKVTNFVIIIVILSTVVIIGLSFVGCKQATQTTTTSATIAATTATTTGATTAASATTIATTAETTAKDATSDQIKVTTPIPNQLIQNPLIVEGEARGTWYFEATFPVKLLDANGNLIASSAAQAQGDWTTDNFVLFKVQIEFKKPATPTGVLVLEKDNPSGLPKNAAKIEIPIRFE